MAVPGTQQHSRASVAHRDQVEPAQDACAHLSGGAGSHIDPRHVAGTWPVRHLLTGREQLGQSELVMLEADDTDQPVRDRPFCQPRVDARLHVDVLVARPRLLDDGPLGAGHSEMVTQQRRQRHLLVGSRRPHRSSHPSADPPSHVSELGPKLGVGQRRPVEAHRETRAVGHPALPPTRALQANLPMR